VFGAVSMRQGKLEIIMAIAENHIKKGGEEGESSLQYH
jgi:hypothetical protein